MWKEIVYYFNILIEFCKEKDYSDSYLRETPDTKHFSVSHNENKDYKHVCDNIKSKHIHHLEDNEEYHYHPIIF